MRPVLLFLFLYVQTACGQYTIHGKVIDRTLKTPLKGAIVYLNLEDYAHADSSKGITPEGKDTLWIEPALIRRDSLITDSTGRFVFHVQMNSKYTVETIIKLDNSWGYWDGERGVAVNAIHESEVILRLPVYCEYAQYKNQDFCPVCKKKDECIPVEYGLPVPDLSKADEGLTDPRKQTVYNAGCMHDQHCDARWYCRRCQKLF